MHQRYRWFVNHSPPLRFVHPHRLQKGTVHLSREKNKNKNWASFVRNFHSFPIALNNIYIHFNVWWLWFSALLYFVMNHDDTFDVKVIRLVRVLKIRITFVNTSKHQPILFLRFCPSLFCQYASFYSLFLFFISSHLNHKLCVNINFQIIKKKYTNQEHKSKLEWEYGRDKHQSTMHVKRKEEKQQQHQQNVYEKEKIRSKNQFRRN